MIKFLLVLLCLAAVVVIVFAGFVELIRGLLGEPDVDDTEPDHKPPE